MRAAVVALIAGGCAASPPVRARVGGTYHPTEVAYHNPDPDLDEPVPTRGVSTGSIGIHAASAAELPFDVGGGVMGDWYRGGAYLEGAYLVRVHPKVRVGVTAAAEQWFLREDGTGGRIGVTIEWTSRLRRGAKTSTEKCVTSSGAYSGVTALGIYVDGGYRWMDGVDDAVSINAGVSVRWPAFAVAAYGFSGGGSSCE